METRVVLCVVLVVSGLVFAPLGAATATTAQGDVANGSDAGERAVGVVGVEGAAVFGAIERARFEGDLETATTDEERARTVAAYLTRSRDLLDALERRERRLDAARENGSTSTAGYDARTARIGARAEAVSRLSTTLANASADLPADLRREHDIEPETIRAVTDRADGLTERTRDDTARVDTAVFGDVARMTDAYNADVGADDSGLLGDQLHGQVVNFHVESPDGSSVVVSFRIDDDGRFTEIRAGPHGDATLRAETDRRTVRRIATADDAADSFRRAVRDDEISIDGIGLVDGLRWRLIDLLSSVSERF